MDPSLKEKTTGDLSSTLSWEPRWIDSCETYLLPHFSSSNWKIENIWNTMASMFNDLILLYKKYICTSYSDPKVQNTSYLKEFF